MTTRLLKKAPLIVVLLGVSPQTLASAIQYALVSKSDGQIVVEIRLTCAHRYESLEPATAARDVVVGLTRLGVCAEAGGGDNEHDSARPAGREMASLEEVDYDARGPTAAALQLQFRDPAQVQVRQEGDLRSVRVVVTLQPGQTPAPTLQRHAGGPPPLPAAPVLSAEQQARVEARVRALARAVPPPPPVGGGDYVINLASSTGPLDAGGMTATLAADQRLYVVNTELDGKTWQQLRLGFYATEQDAEAALQALRARYPNGWVIRIGAAERALAQTFRQAPVEPNPVSAARPSRKITPTLTAEQLGSTMAEARSAVLEKNFDRAVVLYTRVITEPPNDYSQEAQEFLGVARDRNGQTAQAIADYRQYLADYPEGEGAARVRQRLVALTTARDVPKSSLRAASRGSEAGAWDAFGSFSQYYRRDSGDFAGQGMTTKTSLVQTDGDLSLRERGARLDFAGRATLGYDYDLLKGDTGPGNRTRIYNLYADLSDRDWGLEARVGRQAERSGGVLGRYDGAHFSYLVAPDIKVNVIGGFPVYLSSQGLDTNRVFYGTSVDLNHLLSRLDTSVFFNEQRVGSVTDRQGVGAEIRYFDGSRSLIGIVDYDVGFGTLNTLSLLGNWSFESGLAISASADYRRSPFPLTENALIGQTATTIDELLHSLTQDQVRQLALDRSGKMLTYSLGLSRPLAQRWEIVADFTVTQLAEGPGSGGVLALPDSGVEYYVYTNLVGSSLFTEGDVSNTGLGYAHSSTTRTSTVYLDWRYPVTSALRLNPRMAVLLRQISADSSSEWLLKPSMRLLYRFARHYEIDLEGGGELGRRTGGVANTDTTAYYIYMGYRAEF